jgi:hypothetical protein
LDKKIISGIAAGIGVIVVILAVIGNTDTE